MQEFSLRRSKLANLLANDSLMLLPSAQQSYRNSDVEYPFRQNSDFFYLSGFNEPDAVMALAKDSKGKVSYILFSRASNPEAEVWSGKRAGQTGAIADYAANEAYDIAELMDIVPQLLANKKNIYYPLGKDQSFDQKVMTCLQAAKHAIHAKARGEGQTIWRTADTLIDVLPLIHELRLFKSEYEIECMRKAAEISADAHLKLMQSCQAGMYEYQLEAIFNAHCLHFGCRGLAYSSIVAGGNNACTLHYVTNDQKLQIGDLVLVDAGGEYNNYAADITRTFPVSGKFNQEQRQIYALVLQAQLAGIDKVRPGNSFDSVQTTMVEIIVRGLVELGILHGSVQQLIEQKAYRKFYMHSSGHWLGLDVHDVGDYKIDGKWRDFAPGMVLTVEPGIYIPHGAADVDSKWHGIGVRIEDDVLVTKKGNEVLSAKAPKQIAEIERAGI